MAYIRLCVISWGMYCKHEFIYCCLFFNYQGVHKLYLHESQLISHLFGQLKGLQLRISRPFFFTNLQLFCFSQLCGGCFILTGTYYYGVENNPYLSYTGL